MRPERPYAWRSTLRDLLHRGMIAAAFLAVVYFTFVHNTTGREPNGPGKQDPATLAAQR